MAGMAYAKILVVGANTGLDRRRQFENEVVRSLDAQEVEAISTLDMLGPNQSINRDVLTAAARATGADGVLITRLLDAQMSDEASVRRDDQPLADFMREEYAAGRDPMAMGMVRAVIVASDFYDVASETRVWSGQSTAFPKDSVDASIAGIAESVTRVLRAGGWID
jgi:hypothetical protein